MSKNKDKETIEENSKLHWANKPANERWSDDNKKVYMPNCQPTVILVM